MEIQNNVCIYFRTAATCVI